MPIFASLARTLLDPFLLLPQVLLFGIVVRRSFSRLGLPTLFWAGRPSRQIQVGLFLGLTFFHIWLTAFLIDVQRYPQEWRLEWGWDPWERITQALLFCVPPLLLLMLGFFFWRVREDAPPGREKDQREIETRHRRYRERMTQEPAVQVVREIYLGPAFLGGLCCGVLLFVAIYVPLSTFGSEHSSLSVLTNALMRRLWPLEEVVDPSLHDAVSFFFVLLLSLFLVFSRQTDAPKSGQTGWFPTRLGSLAKVRRGPVAAYICVVTSLLTASVAARHHLLPASGALVGEGSRGVVCFSILIGLVMWRLYRSGRTKFKYRIQQMNANYSGPVALGDGQKPSGPGISLKDRFSGEGPIVVLCVSGGGIRAAAWTTAVLIAIERELKERKVRPELFRMHVALVTGASGGMLGASYWVSAGPFGEEAAQHYRKMTTESLSFLVDRFFWSDLLAFLWTKPVIKDRGWALEASWRENLGEAMERSLKDLRKDEERRECPSLVFSPMSVEDGRRFILSNLDFGPVLDIQHRGTRSSLSGLQFSDYFGLDSVDLATAARLSASFPIATPAVYLPVKPPRRVMDAGYYDNYGINLAVEALREARRQTEAGRPQPETEGDARRTFLIEIDAADRSALKVPAGRRPRPDEKNVDPGFQTEQDDAGLEQPSPLVGVLKAFEGWVAPLRALYSSYEAVNSYRNDETLRQELGEEEGFKTVRLANMGVSTLSWKLRETEKARIFIDAEDAVKREFEPGGVLHCLAERLKSSDRGKEGEVGHR